MSFDGFSDGALDLLDRLPGFDKAGFAAAKSDYQELLMEPARAFVTELGERLAYDISPGIVGQPKVNGSIAPINRDLRFDPGGAPYKDHLLFRWWEGDPKKTAPMLMVRLSVTEVGYASGMAFSSTEQWRSVVGDPAKAAALTGIVDHIAGECADLDVAGSDLKRVPAGYGDDHPGARWLRHKGGIQLRWPEPLGSDVGRSAFIDQCASRLARLGPLHRWLVDELG